MNHKDSLSKPDIDGVGLAQSFQDSAEFKLSEIESLIDHYQHVISQHNLELSNFLDLQETHFKKLESNE